MGFPCGSAGRENPPAMQETWIQQSLGWEDPLEKGKATPTPVFWPGEVHEVAESDTTLIIIIISGAGC